MYSLALIIFVVSEKKAFEHFPIGSNVNLCPKILKNILFVEDRQGSLVSTFLGSPSGFREEAF